MNKLSNSKGKRLYSKPENITKASKRRRNKIFGKGLLKYNSSVSLFKMENLKTLTV